MTFDKRLTPARADLAASHLKGRIDAARYADGEVRFATIGRAALKKEPQFDSVQETELLFGEAFTVYERANGWAWGQASLDSYVGYVPDALVSAETMATTHRVAVPMTPLLPAPDIKKPALDMLPMNARVQIVGATRDFYGIAPQGFVYAPHLVPIADRVIDWVAVASEFVGAPYVWGGKTVSGMDCSGLIQTSLQRAGIDAPRDTDMQEDRIGRSIPIALESLKRGDLIFWKGHVGVMFDTQNLLHANAHHMQVAIEPIRQAIARITPVAGSIASVKRI